jgi:hypothetical protein
MWADHGGIDFHGRASWDAWAELKVRAGGGTSPSWVNGSRGVSRLATSWRSPTPGLHAQGMDTEQATAKFCRVYAEAHTPERFSSNFHGK